MKLSALCQVGFPPFLGCYRPLLDAEAMASSLDAMSLIARSREGSAEGHGQPQTCPKRTISMWGTVCSIHEIQAIRNKGELFTSKSRPRREANSGVTRPDSRLSYHTRTIAADTADFNASYTLITSNLCINRLAVLNWLCQAPLVAAECSCIGSIG